MIGLTSCTLILFLSIFTPTSTSSPITKRTESNGFLQSYIDKFVYLLSLYDPIEINEFSFSFMGYELSFSHLHIEGFSNIVLEADVEFSFTSVEINFLIVVPEVFGSVSQWNSTFPFLFGTGKGGVEVTDVYVSFDVEFNLFYETQPSTIVINVGGAQVYLSGIQNDEALSELISYNVNKTLLQLINTINNQQFHRKLESILNFIWATLTF